MKFLILFKIKYEIFNFYIFIIFIVINHTYKFIKMLFKKILKKYFAKAHLKQT